MGRTGIAATELMPDFTGRSLDRGRFRLLENLGSGAYGKVYRAIDAAAPPSKQNVFAVKCLNKPKPGSHTDLLQRREFAHHKLVSDHPNVVTFYHHFSDGLYVYVVLDLCSGGDLFAAITEKRLFHNNGRLIQSVFVQLIDAVQYCHELGIFHRDIKPENVLCSNDGKDVRLADFGLSIKSPICHDFGCGSSYYMSPECIGQEINTGRYYSTRHNDIWALGVILTNMITGRNPWRYATTDDDCFAAYLHDNDFLYQVLPISDGVNTILKKIFNVNPLRRISLPQLRRDILALTALFDDDRDSTMAIARNTPYVHLEETKAETKALNSEVVSIRSVNSDERYIFPSPVIDQLPIHAPFHGRLGAIIETSNAGHFIGDSLAVPLSTHSSGSSAPDSRGPITPATHAVVDGDLLIDISDIPEEGGLGPPVGLIHAATIGKVKASAPVNKSRRPTQIFRSAVQRIMGLSGRSFS